MLLVSLLCFLIKDTINYRIAALILLLTVSVVAMLFDIFPVLLAAFLSALIWNFLFIEPQFTFAIRSTEDFLMFLSLGVSTSAGIPDFRSPETGKYPSKLPFN